MKRELMNWSTHPVAPTRSREKKWKRSLGEACPHGLEIFLVNGSHVRNTMNSDFDQGGNGYAYHFVPRGEIWIDESVPEEEWPYVALHECHETFLMKDHGYDYNRAHASAKRLENKFRRQGHPGEEKRA